MLLRKFPSIDQFRHVVEDVRHKAEFIGLDAQGKPRYDASRPKPVLTFAGTVKLHGSNCGVAFDLLSGEVSTQSRERILSVDEDNMEFCAWVESAPVAAALQLLRNCALAQAVMLPSTPMAACRVFGEWCGPVVNAKTGIGRLPMRWVVFGVLLTASDGSESWLPLEQVARAWAAHNGVAQAPIYFICDYKQWAISIDFNDPAASLDELERLTLDVEASCPVAVAMGGDGIGEGIVWVCQDPVYGRAVFKTKGAKHKGTKNSRLVQIEPEVLASLDAFTAAVLTESRLEQGYAQIVSDYGTFDLKHIGDFLMWIGQDVLKEEADTLKVSGLERKQVMGRVNQYAKQWLSERLSRF